MGIEQAKQLCLRANQELFAGCDLESADEMFAADFLDHEAPAGAPRGPESAKATVRWLHGSLGDIGYVVEDVVAEGDRVVLRVTMRGTHDKAFLGHPPTGKRFEVAQIHIFRVAADRIAEHWACRDDAGMFRQLGIAPG